MSATGTRRRPRGRRARLLAAALAALSLLGPYASPAAGDHGGRPIGSLLACDRPVSPPRCTSVGNNARHWVHLDESVTEGLASSLRDTMAEDYDARTHLEVLEQATVTTITDVIVFSNDYGENGAAGWVYCPPDAPQGINELGDRWCRQQELYFNLNPRYAAFFADDASRDHVACHELGHTLGLRHWGNPPDTAPPAAATCMNGNTPNGPTDLHLIDVDHLNAYYTARDVAPRLDPRRTLVHAPADEPRFVAAWSATLVDALEPEHYATLGELTTAADAVVRGRISAVEPGPTFGIPSRRTLRYAAATIEVDELLAGALPPGGATTATLEIPLFAGPGSLAEMRSWLPDVESVFFLRRKADAPEVHRLVVQHGVVVNDAGSAAVIEGDGGFLDGVAGEPFAQLVERVRFVGQASGD